MENLDSIFLKKYTDLRWVKLEMPKNISQKVSIIQLYSISEVLSRIGIDKLVPVAQVIIENGDFMRVLCPKGIWYMVARDKSNKIIKKTKYRVY